MLRLLLLLAAAVILTLILSPLVTFWRIQSDMRASYEREYPKAAAAAEKERKMRDEPAQTNPEEWRALLQELSDLAIADEQVRGSLTAEQIEKRWLGEPPATDEQIAAAELRLGVSLPPSYRAFLKISNGWHHPTFAITRLASIEEVGFTRDIDPQLVEAWADYDSRPEIDSAKTLLISIPSDYDDGDRLMLNPVRIHDGEMEAWRFSNFYPGAKARHSFWHLMVDEVETWKYLADDGS